MIKPAILSTIALVVLAAACSPADVPVPVVHAVSLTAQVALHPQPAPGAGDGHVDEYH